MNKVEDKTDQKGVKEYIRESNQTKMFDSITM